MPRPVAVAREREEAREVVGACLDRLGEDLEPVALGGAAARDRGDGAVARRGDVGRRARGVVSDLRLDPRGAQEVLDLRERLRVRARDLDVLDLRPGDRQKTVAYAHDGLGHDAHVAVVAKQVVYVRDRPRVRVLDRHDGRVDVSAL